MADLYETSDLRLHTEIRLAQRELADTDPESPLLRIVRFEMVSQQVYKYFVDSRALGEEIGPITSREEALRKYVDVVKQGVIATKSQNEAIIQNFLEDSVYG